MATQFSSPVTAAQVGTYFVGQYYQVLQQAPDSVYQFYSEASTMLRTDGNIRDTASAMLQIHALVSALSYSAIEIKTAHSLESWNGGVLVIVSGSVQLKDFNTRRKFVETFFLAPQEKGYFVLNDVFQYVDEEQRFLHPAVYLPQNNLDLKLDVPTAVQEPGSYLLNEEFQCREFMSTSDIKENSQVENYAFGDESLQQVHDSERIFEQEPEQVNGSFQPTVESVQLHDYLPAPVDEPVAEPQKHTYASILRVAKAQPAPSATSQPPLNSSRPASSEWNHIPEPANYQVAALSDSIEKSGTYMNAIEEEEEEEEEDEIKSVYVKNIQPSMTESEIEEGFKKFGEIKPDGVIIRSRKDIGICYAFVEFEDMTGVQNAIEAGSTHVAGRPVYIEERRPNCFIPSRGARGRGRGRGSYYTEASRGRYVSRSYGQNGGDRDYTRSRGSGNGYYRPSTRQVKSF